MGRDEEDGGGSSDSDGNVLDIGTGDGSFLLRIAEQNPKMVFLGIEQDAELLARAKSRLKETGLSNVQFRQLFFDAKFGGNHDVIFTRFTLQHSSEPEEFLQTAFRSLNVGGKFMCIEPVYDYYDSEPPMEEMP